MRSVVLQLFNTMVKSDVHWQVNCSIHFLKIMIHCDIFRELHVVFQGFYSFVIVFPKDRPVNANGREWPNMLTLYGIPWWLQFLSPLHNFAFPLLSYVRLCFDLPCYMTIPLIGLQLYIKHVFQLHLWKEKFRISYQTWPLAIPWWL